MDQQPPLEPHEPLDPLAVLEASGYALDALTQEQRTVLAALSAEEVSVLAGIKGRLDEAGPEVEAHLMVGGLFF
ncbi:aroma-sacti cluster domain-containing protein [Kitasatospora sp. NPDC057223]|uniref:aroma-sacti cluster domain-containing protein n=1 Tax=Kitasatospora sp. NPDC057223 TaxID=3346055 RepID=UPI003645C763